MATLTEATIFDVTGRYELARIGLNGYKSNTTNPTEIDSQERTIWSFKIVAGDATSIYEAWSDRRAIILRNSSEEKHVRVAAYPAGEDSFGLIEFI